MQCMIRFDDITPEMNLDKFNKVKSIINAANIKPLIGVVPCCQDTNLFKEESNVSFWDEIKSLQQSGWMIAQHGTNHVYETKDTGILGINPFSEFAGLIYEKQHEKLKMGQSILHGHGIDTDIFMAPGHTFDDNTLKALYDLDFRTVTDGLASKPYIFQNLLFVPCRMIGNYRLKGIDTLCFHTNVMSDDDIREFEQFVQNHRKDIVDFDPARMRTYAKKRSFFMRIEEILFVKKRHIKDKVAHSKKLIWYLEWTNDNRSLYKWLKRGLLWPVLLFKK